MGNVSSLCNSLKDQIEELSQELLEVTNQKVDPENSKELKHRPRQVKKKVLIMLFSDINKHQINQSINNATTFQKNTQ